MDTVPSRRSESEDLIDEIAMIFEKIGTVGKAGHAMMANSDFSVISKTEWLVFALDTLEDYLVKLHVVTVNLAQRCDVKLAQKIEVKTPTRKTD